MMHKHMTAIVLWVLALLLAATMAGLGLWQLERRDYKKALLDQHARALQAAAQPLETALASADAVSRVAGCGHWQAPVLVLDNQQHSGRAGHRSFQPWRSEAGTLVLVEQGWRGWDGARTPPSITLLHGRQCLQGLLLPAPSPGLRAGPPQPQALAADGWLLTGLDAASLQPLLAAPAERLAARILRPQPPLLAGYQLPAPLLANTLPPDKHLGYAVQWFALAATLLLLALCLSLRRFFGRPHPPLPGDRT